MSDSHGALKARNVHSNALVNSCSEREVTVWSAFHIENLRVEKLVRVAICSANAQCDWRAWSYLYVTYLCVRYAQPVAQLVRAFIA